MEIQEYLTKKKKIQSKILEFIDSDEKIEEKFQNLIQILNDQKIREDRYEMKAFLYLISKIINNHDRSPDFFTKTEKILLLFKNEIQQNFSNFDIFSIFKSSKRFLLFLIHEQIIKIDEMISNILTNEKYKKRHYPHYFYPEIKQFITPLLDSVIRNSISENFEEKRNLGENDHYLSQIIRKDAIDDFITYVNRANYSLDSKIEESIYETNLFLLKKKKQPSLIEYSAFFGSVQIFKYLYLNNVNMKPSIWKYAIHGRNPELIHLIEENNIEPIYKVIQQDEEYTNYYYLKKISSYEGCFKEAIKCHHNEIADYIQGNHFNCNKESENIENMFDRNLFACCFHFYNFEKFPLNFNFKFLFFYLCKYDYYTLLKILLDVGKIDINEKIIFKIILFIKFQKKKISSNFK